MGGRSPAKPADQRLGHPSRSERAAPTVFLSPMVELGWPEPDPVWTESARAWFAALGESGQAKHYQPSDVEHARVMAGILDKAERWHDAALYRVWLAGSKSLMTTELERRLGRMDLGPASRRARTREDGPVPAAVSVADELAAARARLGG